MNRRARMHIGLWLAGSFFAASSVMAQASYAEETGFQLVKSYEFSTEPLTTEKLWILDPTGVNPHRQRWVLNRRLSLRGLEPREFSSAKKDGKYGVKAASVASVSLGFIRPQGAWYRPITEFPCQQEPQAWFATADGARIAVDTAAATWDKILTSEKAALLKALNDIRASSAEQALRLGLIAYDSWYKRVEAEYLAQGQQKARLAEWRSYLQSATDAGVCSKKKPVPTVEPVSWKAMMEPPTGRPPVKPIARAPARRWNGLYSVRLSMDIGNKTLTGQFLVDSGAAKTVVSPTWLESQGIPVSWIRTPGAKPQRVTWSGGSGLAPVGEVDRVLLSGKEIGINQVLIFDVDFFAPPANVASCCDGILGNDFLSKNVVSLRSAAPYELVLWPKEGFSQEKSYWTEASVSLSGDMISDCVARSEKDPFHSKGVPVLKGVRWDSGSEMPMDVHLPWKKAIAAGGREWSLECDTQVVARNVEATSPDQASEQSPFGKTYPALNVGIPLLARGLFTFDLPHGRIWFSEEALGKPIPENRSGLSLKYVLFKGDRVLKVAGLRPGTAADTLKTAGLQIGTEIQRIDGKNADELNQWEVDHRLSGAYGDRVELEWATSKKEVKVAPLQVR